MKMVRRSRTPSFRGQSGEMIPPRKRMASAKQGAVNPTKNPGSKGSRVPKGVRRK
jgi:hypothetical protein